MQPKVTIDIDSPLLPGVIDQCSESDLNTMRFGAIRVNLAGKVTLYSDVERRLSGWNKDALSRDFFTDMAPCLNRPSFKARIDRALEAGRLDIAFDDVMDLPSGERAVERRIRVLSAAGGGYWILMQAVN